MADLGIKSAEECRYDEVSLGEVMMRIDPGDVPTGAVNYETGPEYIEAISKRGFTPVLGMSAPLQLVADRKKPGDHDTVIESLQTFKAKFEKKCNP